MTQSQAADRAAESPGAEQHSAATLFQLLMSASLVQAVHVLAGLGMADLLAAGPRTVEELADEVRVHAPSLRRTLRAAAAAGVFAERPDGLFELTPAANYLRSDVPGSLRHLAAFRSATNLCHCHDRFLEALRTGRPSFPAAHGGLDYFSYLSSRPELLRDFDNAMTALSELQAPAIAASYDFGGFGTLADIGGGQGYLLASILRTHRGVRGVLFDRPDTVAGAPELLRSHGVADRVSIVSGDFFRSVPSGADAYLVKSVLHDWGDEECLRILRAVRAAMGAPGRSRLLLWECVVPPLNAPDPSKLLDLDMMVKTGGRERTEQEWHKLLRGAGFSPVSTRPSVPPLWLMEARPM